MSEQQLFNYCPAHMEFVTNIAEIRTSLSNIEKGLAEDAGFKRGIITAFLGIAITIIIQVGAFAYLWGGMAKQVEINTGRLTVLETMEHK
jgi:hypothetical protein